MLDPSGPLGREVPVRPAGPRRGADGFRQAGERYRCLPAREKAALIDNMAASLAVEPTSVRRCVIGYARQADENFGGGPSRADPGVSDRTRLMPRAFARKNPALFEMFEKVRDFQLYLWYFCMAIHFEE
ncbi:MAG: catalase-related domain-containing protein [Oscillospiraceae bacterium]